jgi:hypothetical protein
MINMYPAPLEAPIAHIQIITSYMYPAPLVAPIAHIQVIPSYMYPASLVPLVEQDTCRS